MAHSAKRGLAPSRAALEPFAALVMGKNGEPVVTGEPSILKQAAAAAGNEFVAYRLDQATERIMEGASLGEALGIYSVFPSGAIQMLTVGEEAANLTQMVKHVADLYDTEVELALNDIASVLEPAIMVVMGCVVGFIVLSAVLPTVQLIQNL